jgi:L-rhamnose mutarotase
MKRQDKIWINLLIMISLLVISNFSVYAQPDDTALFESVTDTPINTSLALMAAAGIGYGLKKLNIRKK